MAGTEGIDGRKCGRGRAGKVKNRYESEQIFNNLNYLNVATNLAYFELTGKAEDINNEVNKYRSVTAGQIKEAAQKHLCGKIVPHSTIKVICRPDNMLICQCAMRNTAQLVGKLAYWHIGTLAIY